MIDKERLQRIGELLAELMASSESKGTQSRLSKEAQRTLDYITNPLHFPPEVVKLNKNGRIGFCLAISNPAGSAVIYYDPAPAVEKLLEQLEKEACEEIDKMYFEDEEEFQETSSEVYYSTVTSYSWDFTQMLLKLLYSEFENTVKSLPEIARKLDYCITEATQSHWGEIIVENDDGSIIGRAEDSRHSDPIEDKTAFSVTEFINKSLREMNKERKKQWIAEVNSSLAFWTGGNLRDLALHFQRVYLVWKKAKDMYKESQKSAFKKKRISWRKDILDEFEKELKNFRDLIGRLADPPEVSDEDKEKLLEKGGTSAPSDIALEHAARLCGASPYEYTIRHLKSVLSKKGMSVKKVKFIQPS